MAKNLSLPGEITRFLFVGVNVFFNIIGLALLGVGIYMLIVGQSYAYVTGSQYTIGAAIVMICGLITCIISVVAIIGGLTKNSCLLLIYSLVMIAICLLQIAIGVCSFKYRTQITNTISNKFITALQNYTTSDSEDYDEDGNTFIDSVQRDLHCCGFSGPGDWLKYNLKYVISNSGLPSSCYCDSVDGKECINFKIWSISITVDVYSEGCNSTLYNLLNANILTLGSVSIGFGLMEIFGIMLSLLLCACISGRRLRRVEYVKLT